MRRAALAVLAGLLVVAPAAALPAAFVPYTDQRVTAVDGDPNDLFGSSLAMADGLLLVGASGDEHGGEDAGSAYLVPATGGPVQAKLVAPDADPGDRFGASVALDGDLAVVGASLDDEAADDAGAVYVYRAGVDGWTLEAKLFNDQPEAGDLFGVSVALSDDHLAVGAVLDDEAADRSGSVTVFARDGWTREATLVGSDAGERDRFGRSVAWAGSTLVVGAPSHDTDEALAGAVYAFDRSGDGWDETAHLDGHRHDAWLGWDVDGSRDRIVAGAPREASDVGEETGMAVTWRRTLEGWERSATIEPDPPEDGEWFGAAVALSGGTLAVGAPRSDGGGLSHPAAEDVGSVHVLHLVDGLWLQVEELVHRDGAAGDMLGWGVELGGGTLAAGAARDDVRGTDDGSVRLWRGPTAAVPP